MKKPVATKIPAKRIRQNVRSVPAKKIVSSPNYAAWFAIFVVLLVLGSIDAVIWTAYMKTPEERQKEQETEAFHWRQKATDFNNRALTEMGKGNLNAAEYWNDEAKKYSAYADKAQK